VGWDNVDHEAAGELGILVYRTAGVLTQAVSELTLGLILSALRSIPLHDRQIRERLWEKRMGRLLAGKRVGIIGFGAIGQRVGELVHAFGADVIFYDPQTIAVEWAQAVSLESILKKADIISIHASGKERLLGSVELNTIAGRNVILVNTSRGGLIDEEALLKHLTTGQIGYTCLDVFAEEPYSGPLRELNNVILTPHIGSYAREARDMMEEAAVHNLITGLKEKAII
jgi:D-3-phosphoglycerate dehydrogenase / 2-oxoglutarate reductase